MRVTRPNRRRDSGLCCSKCASTHAKRPGHVGVVVLAPLSAGCTCDNFATQAQHWDLLTKARKSAFITNGRPNAACRDGNLRRVEQCARPSPTPRRGLTGRRPTPLRHGVPTSLLMGAYICPGLCLSSPLFALAGGTWGAGPHCPEVLAPQAQRPMPHPLQWEAVLPDAAEP